MIRIGSINTGNVVRKALNTDYRLQSPADALAWISQSIDKLVEIVDRAGDAGCDVAVLPEDTLCLASWIAANRDIWDDVLPEAVENMLDRFAQVAAKHNMYLICCNDILTDRKTIQNTAFFLGRDGKEIGRYQKVMLPVQESLKEPGTDFPVFETPDLGTVGILICYDMIFPEPSRCLALAGADVIFNPTVGGAAFGGQDISRAAFRTRAVENFVYITVSWGGWGSDAGSAVISPHGEYLVEENRGGEIAVVDVDPFDGRQCADWSNAQEDMRSRLFSERRPETYGMLIHSNPPALDKLPDLYPGSPKEIAQMVQGAITIGHKQYAEAEAYVKAEEIDQAIEAFRALKVDYPGTWFDRMAGERLAVLQKSK